MNKRHFKRLLQYDIADAVELTILKYQKEGKADTPEVNAKIDELLCLYDDVLSNVHGEKLLKSGKEKKKHFRDLLTGFDKEMEKIFSGK
ncbi:MAG: hypothetical protein H7X71_00700 [Chitinophagales bacterium]|nr:hypothetical protein [Chitinophagales bacterium]